MTHPAVYSDWSEKVQTGTTQKKVQTGSTVTYVAQNVWSIVGYHNEDYSVSVSDGWKQVPQKQWVLLPERKIKDYTLDAKGTVYAKGNIFFSPMATFQSSVPTSTTSLRS